MGLNLGVECVRVGWLAHRDVFHPRAGGAERTAYEVLRRLAQRGHDVTLMSCDGTGVHHTRRVVSGITIECFPTVIHAHIVPQILRRLDRDFDFVVDDLSHVVPWMTPYVSSARGVAYFRHLHARTLPGQVDRVQRVLLCLIERAYPSLYRTWPFVTESEAAKFDLKGLGVPLSRIYRVPPGVDTKFMRPGKLTPEPQIVYFGGFRAYKRPSAAIEVVRALRSQLPGVHMVMIGDGPELEACRRLASRLDLQGAVTFRGRVTDSELSAIVGESWVNLHCSVAEGWGQSIMEAAAAGVPTAAFSVVGVSETVRDRFTGLLAQSGDVRGLAECVHNIVVARERFSERCRSWAGAFDWDATVDRWDEIIAGRQPDS
jgi:glycosyltransferase involved in cell wall biosynthesis